MIVWHRGSKMNLKLIQTDLKMNLKFPKWSPPHTTHPIPIPGVSKRLLAEGKQIRTKHIVDDFL